MANFVAGQPYTGKVIDPSQGGAVVDYKPNTGDTSQAQQQQQSGVQLSPTSSAITPSALTPAQPIVPVTTPPVTPPVAPALTTPPADTSAPQPLPQESAIYKMMQDLQGNTNALGSEAAFRTAQDAKYGVTEKQGLVNSLKTKFDDLTRQAEGVKLQQQQDIQNIQQSAQAGGANVTRGGIAPQERAMTTQRNQQLLTLGIQQHQIAAQHALASGDLATALSLSDRAVKMEYQPKKDALDAQRANIELLLKDPTLTLAQQKRAEDAKKANDEAQAKLAADTKDKETVQGLILQAVQNGAPAALIAQAQKDGTIFGTAGILSGYTAKETAQSIQEYNFAKKNGYKGSFSDYQNEDANRKAVIAKAGSAGSLASPILTKVLTVAGQFDNEAVVKNYNVIKEGKQFVDNISNDTQNPADQQGLIYAFAKAMDPNSVVREGEYATVQKYAQSWASTFGFNAERIFSNSPFLSKEAIINMKKTIDAKASASEQNYKNVYDEYARRINKVGGVTDGADYITDYSKGYGGNTDAPKTPASDFDKYTNDITPSGTTDATMPRSVWAGVQNKDALLAYVKSLGRTLKITD